MKICYICADPGIPIFGRKGCSTHVRETCRALRNLGHEIKIISGNVQGEPAMSERYDAIGVQPYTSRRIGFDFRNILLDFRVRRALSELAASWRPDVIYERYSLYSQAGTWFADRFALPRVVEVNAFLTREQAGRLRLPWLAGVVEKRILRRAPRLIVVSEPLRSEIQQLGVSRDIITKMPMAVNLDMFHPRSEPSELRTSLGLDKRFVIGYVGTLSGWHGLSLLYDVCRELIAAGAPPFAFLVVGGDGRKLALHREQTKAAGLEDVLRFAGSVPYEEVPAVLNAVDAAIVPDTTYWSSPAKMFEYQAAGLPVFAPAYPAVLEAIDDGVEGVIHPARDVARIAKNVLTLMGDPDLCRRLGAAARIRAERDHSWDHNGRAILDLYAQLGVRG